MRKKNLLFDFDGTIADTAGPAVRIYNDIARDQCFSVIRQDELATLRSMGAMDVVRYLGVPVLKLPFIAKKVRVALKAEIPRCSAIRGVPEQLRALKIKGHRLHIVSSNSMENICLFMEANKIDAFDGLHSVSNLFGKHIAIRSLMRSRKWDRDTVLYIGDEVRDIEAARRAGVTAVAVTWGYNTKEALIKNKPDILLEDPLELGSL